MPHTPTSAASPFVLDIGGEGRHPLAWNLNKRVARSFGPARGEPIPRLICGRGDAIPLGDDSVDQIIVERTPLRAAALREILRVAKPAATVTLRHAVTPAGDPHRLALRLLPGTVQRRNMHIGANLLRETVIALAEESGHRADRGRAD